MFTAQAQVNKIETMADRGMRLVVHTQELSPESMAALMGLYQEAGWFAFSPSPVSGKDIPETPVEFDDQKPYSQRVRNVLYLLHTKEGGKPEDFNARYSAYMEKIIQSIKDKLDDLPQNY